MEEYIEEVNSRLEEIEECKHDDEKAHSLQDELMADVLEWISDGVSNPKLLATLTLKVLEIDFSRWCA